MIPAAWNSIVKKIAMNTLVVTAAGWGEAIEDPSPQAVGSWARLTASSDYKQPDPGAQAVGGWARQL